MEGQQVAAASKCRKKEGRQWIWNKKREKKNYSRDFLVRFSPFSFPSFFCAVFFSVPVCFVAVHRETHCVFECTSGGAVEGIETERKVPFLYIFFLYYGKENLKKEVVKRNFEQKGWNLQVVKTSSWAVNIFITQFFYLWIARRKILFFL